MSNWRPITTDDLNAASVSNKVTLIRNVATQRSLPDPAPAAILVVTQELRAMIGFSGKYAIDQNATAIPNGLLDLAIKKIVREMCKAVQYPLSKDEEADEKTYETRLDKLRSGQWPVDAPDNPIVSTQTTVGPAAQNLSSQHRRFTRHGMRGL